MIKHLYTYSGSGTDPYRNLALEQYLTEHVADDACILYLLSLIHISEPTRP